MRDLGWLSQSNFREAERLGRNRKKGASTLQLWPPQLHPALFLPPALPGCRGLQLRGQRLFWGLPPSPEPLSPSVGRPRNL